MASRRRRILQNINGNVSRLRRRDDAPQRRREFGIVASRDRRRLREMLQQAALPPQFRP